MTKKDKKGGDLTGNGVAPGRSSGLHGEARLRWTDVARSFTVAMALDSIELSIIGHSTSSTDEGYDIPCALTDGDGECSARGRWWLPTR
jgi:hypothetical protein